MSPSLVRSWPPQDCQCEGRASSLRPPVTNIGASVGTGGGGGAAPGAAAEAKEEGENLIVVHLLCGCVCVLSIYVECWSLIDL